MELWQKYAELRAESLRTGGRGEEATEFYRQNQAAMDEGAIVAWPARYNPDELSAIQHAMNLRLQDEAAFFAEYQNEPLPDTTSADTELTADAIAAKLNHLKRYEIPESCSCITMFIDVHQQLLYYLITAWEPNFSGYVIDYGTWPEQKRPYFTLRNASPTLVEVTSSSTLELAISAGLEALAERFLSYEFRRTDGAILYISRCLIDANWGLVTDLVYAFCKQSKYARVLLPSHGKYIGASSKPMSEYPKRPGDRSGLAWRITLGSARRGVRHVLYDTNFWKSFVYARLATPQGSAGGLSLFGDKPAYHRLFADHLTAEYRIKTEGRGRVVDEWKIRPDKPDNHWFDCLAGAAVAASIEGIQLPALSDVPSPLRGKKERISFAALQRAKWRR